MTHFLCETKSNLDAYGSMARRGNMGASAPPTPGMEGTGEMTESGTGQEIYVGPVGGV